MRKLNAFAVYLLMEGGTSLFFSMIVAVNMIYQVTTVGLNPLQLVLVGTVLEATAFVFEVPTGIVADVYSRRLSIIIGYVLVGLGFVLEGLVPRFEAILLAQVAFCWLMCITMSFRTMGRDYESAVMAAGFCGFMLGITANAIACMEELVEKYGPAPEAFLTVPIVGAFLIDFTNSLIITTMANLLR